MRRKNRLERLIVLTNLGTEKVHLDAGGMCRDFFFFTSNFLWVFFYILFMELIFLFFSSFFEFQMLGMQYTNNLQAKGVLDVNCFTSAISSSSPEVKCNRKDGSFAGNEPVSVLDTRSPSPSTSTSTLSSSFGDTNCRGNGENINTANLVVGSEKGNPKGTISVTGPTTTTAATGEEVGVGVPKEEWVAEMQDIPPGLELNQVMPEKFNLGLEDWESLLSESAGQDPSLLRWISGDAEDSSMNMKQLLHGTNSNNDIGDNVGYVGFEDALAAAGSASIGDMLTNSNTCSALGLSGFGFSLAGNNGKLDCGSNSLGLTYGYGNPQYQNLSSAGNTSFCLPSSLTTAQQQQPVQRAVGIEQKPQNFNPQSTTNQLQVQQNAPNLLLLNSLMFGTHEDQPQPKRHNPGIMNPPSSVWQNPKIPFLDPGNEFLLRKQQVSQIQQLGFGQQLNLLPQQKPLMVPKQERIDNNGGNHPMLSIHHQQQQQQQVVYDQLYKATELILAGNFSHAQGILARLNHLLSPVVKPFQRAAFYFKESLQFSLQMSNSAALSPGLRTPTPFDGMFKMGAYKMLSEVSPILHFMNFTSNQALLEALDNAVNIHIIDFDIGFGAQWSSFMQELPKRNKGSVSLKITAFASPSTHHSFDISLMHESLSQFANDVGVIFELEVVNFDSFDPSTYPVSSFRCSENEVIAVNFPIWSIASRPSVLPSLLCFLKQLSPKIVVLLDRGCERFDLPPTHHLLHALHYYEVLLNSIDSANMSADAVGKIEKFLLQPRIENIVLGRLNSPNHMPTWTNLFASAGFSSVPLSNLSEAQAKYMVMKTQVNGFHVEKRQASLVLCWQRRELLSASVWRF